VTARKSTATPDTSAVRTADDPDTETRTEETPAPEPGSLEDLAARVARLEFIVR
jgi:hypothetical protein